MFPETISPNPVSTDKEDDKISVYLLPFPVFVPLCNRRKAGKPRHCENSWLGTLSSLLPYTSFLFLFMIFVFLFYFSYTTVPCACECCKQVRTANYQSTYLLNRADQQAAQVGSQLCAIVVGVLVTSKFIVVEA